MVNLNQISVLVLFALLLLMVFFYWVDVRKKRIIKYYPKISFILPCYNDGDSVESTIKSIYDSYDSDKIELIVINDKSIDNSLEILNELKKRYKFILINNTKNIGKAESLNNASKIAKHSLLWIVDADIIINRNAIEDVLKRMQSDENTVAVSCPYKIRNKGFWGRMQELECNMMSLLLTAHNMPSTLGLWGGCLAVQKKAFMKVGRFSTNMLTEDIELAFKLMAAGKRVEHSSIPVSAYSSDNLKAWYKQKIRWVSGAVQCYIKHIRVLLRHPLQIIFLALYSVLSVIFIIYLIKDALFIDNIYDSYEALRQTTGLILSLKAIGVYYGLLIFKNFISRLYFAVFAIPYVWPSISNFKESYKILYTLPFTLIYWPVYTIVATIGIFKAIFTYDKLKKVKRAW